MTEYEPYVHLQPIQTHSHLIPTSIKYEPIASSTRWKCEIPGFPSASIESIGKIRIKSGVVSLDVHVKVTKETFDEAVRWEDSPNEEKVVTLALLDMDGHVIMKPSFKCRVTKGLKMTNCESIHGINHAAILTLRLTGRLAVQKSES